MDSKSINFCSVLAICLTFLFVTNCQAKKATIDLGSDKALEEFTSNTCHYTPDYEDYYWAWGCPAQIHEYDLSTDSEGFWSPCKKNSCQMLYFNTAKPTSVSLDVFIEGDGAIEVSGKRTPTYPEFYTVISRTVAGKNKICSGTIEIDLRNHAEIYALNVTSISKGWNGYVLIDKATVCFADSDTDCFASPPNPLQCVNAPDTPDPTTPPAPEPTTDSANSLTGFMFTLFATLAMFVLI